MPAAPFRDRSALVFDGGTPVTAAIAHALTDAGARVALTGPDAARPPEGVTDTNFVIVGTAPAVGRGLSDVSGSEFRRASEIQILRPWLILKHTLPLLRASPAAIVVLLPHAGLGPARDNIFDCAAFGALQSMFKSMALECGRDHPHVRVNAVVTGGTEPHDAVAASVMHLLSPAADFMTGAAVGVGAS